MPFRERIFGRNYRIKIQSEQRDKIFSNLNELMKLYPDAETIEDDIVFKIVDHFDQDIIARNPGSHEETKRGFIIHYSKFSIHYTKSKDNRLECEILPKIQKNVIMRYLKKLNNIQYDSVPERLAQIITENLLIPSIYFNEDLAPVHSAGIADPDERAILLGGTGGVGKTSLEIELCRNHGCSFINDDISVINGNGQVYSNLAFPKIYGYNLENNDEVKKIIFGTMPLHDKLAWHLKYRFLGPSKVRRKISPDLLYDHILNKKTLLHKYIILMREDVSSISIETVEPHVAADATLQVMKTEYSFFHTHLQWHQYNSELMGRKPIIKVTDVFDRWKTLYFNVFKTIPVYRLIIPLKIDHNTFLQTAAPLILETN